MAEFAEHGAGLDAVLSPQESAQVHSRGDRRAAARLSRGLLRLLLADYLELPFAEIEIDRSCPDCGRAHGKPRLSSRPGPETPTIQFSVSHGGDLLVLAFAADTLVGVDVEPVGTGYEVPEDLLDFTLTAPERARFQETPGPQRKRGFLRRWTGKEAVLKALGTGLDVEPQAVTLPPASIGGAAQVVLPGSPSLNLWTLNIDVGTAHVCTLATGRRLRDVRSTRLSPSFLLDHLGH